MKRNEILSLFKKLSPHQFDKLVFLLEVPPHEQPAETLDFEHKTNELLKWAQGPPSKVDNLLVGLHELVGVSPPNSQLATVSVHQLLDNILPSLLIILDYILKFLHKTTELTYGFILIVIIFQIGIYIFLFIAVEASFDIIV